MSLHGRSLALLGGFLLVAGATASAQDKAPPARELHYLQHMDESRALRDLQPRAAEEEEASRTRLPGKMPARPMPLSSALPDAAVQTAAGPLAAVTPGLNFDGIATGIIPDANGAVGATQYVEWVNPMFAVYDKATGTRLYGPAPGNTIWQGFGGSCEWSNDGDPIAQYDKSANRWVMTQFSIWSGEFLQCVAVSTTSDALGTYRRFAFRFPYLNDYPKLAVWSDAYYLSVNLYSGDLQSYYGPRVCALDRSAMTSPSASPAPMQCFQVGTSYGTLMPADLDGTTPPPAGSPNYLLSLGAANSLLLWRFHVDWSRPQESYLQGPVSIPTSPFSPACATAPGGWMACVTQPGTTQKLSAMSDRLMYRLAYRNFGTHESLAVSHTVSAASLAAPRWYEIRNPNGTPVIHQQGTFALGSHHRFMGSVAMDKKGNMLLGYTAASGTVRPGPRITGRLATDPPGQMQAETVVFNGVGSQYGSDQSFRWGDYASMSLDPVDDCTFWFTGEYLTGDGPANFGTRVASYRFPNCAGGGTPLDAQVVEGESSVPSTLLPGATRQVTVRVKNTGTTTWTPADSVRLGTGPGNTVSWSGFSCGGFANSPSDARAYLCSSVAPGAAADLTFSVTAPPSGAAVFSVRMVKEQVAWFGENQSWSIPGSDPCRQNVAPDHWKGEYWSNPDLSGASAMVRDDGIQFLSMNFGDGGPGGCGLGTDRFSARWTRTMFFNAGTYVFTARVDDGVRLYVDGQIRIEQWRDQPPTTYTANVVLGTGSHEVRFEYYENGSGAVAELQWALLGGGNQPLEAEVLEGQSSVPASLGPGETRSVTVRVKNTGTSTWTAADSVRLGAASDNSVAWSGFSCGGYVNNVADARAYLCSAVAPGATADFTFSVKAPASGSGVFSVRMVKELVAWFGENQKWTIPVANNPCQANVPAERWKGEYFAGTTLGGAVAMTRDEGPGALAFDWGSGGPNTCGIGVDNFSVRWTKTATFSAGTYKFTARVDDGVRIYVDNTPILDKWLVQAPTTYEATVNISAGSHLVRVEYFEQGGGAVAQVSWQPTGGGGACQANVPAERWKGEYFANRDLTGAPAMVRDDGNTFLSFDWGGGSPSSACGIPQDVFSARFTRTAAFEGATYRFSVTGDDGVRLYVDGQIQIDQWKDQAPTTYTKDVTLAAGNHTIRLDYYENAGGAVAGLSWLKVTGGGGDSIFGMNIDPANPAGNPPAATLKDAGTRWVRVEWKLNPGYSFYDPTIAAYRAAGLKVLLLVDYSSIYGKPASNAGDAAWNAYLQTFRTELAGIAQHYGNGVDAWQVWNEPDLLHPGTAYDPGVPDRHYGVMLRDAVTVIRAHSQAPVVTGGLASGDAGYLQRAINASGGLTADAVAVHPYGQRAPDNWPTPTWGFGNMRDLFNRYLAFGKPVWVTEIGVDTTDQAFQAQYLENVYRLVQGSFPNRVPRVFWFCWSDGMVPSFGVVDGGGQPKASHGRYRGLAGAW